MPLKLVSANPTDEQLRKFIVYINPDTQEPAPLNGEGEPEEGWEAITFYLAQIPSGVFNTLQDELFTFKKDGSSVMLTGSSVSRKMRAAVRKWEGVTDEHGQPAPVTSKALDLLPIWVQNTVVDEINRLNSLGAEKELD